jgi:hypothetical protein
LIKTDPKISKGEEEDDLEYVLLNENADDDDDANDNNKQNMGHELWEINYNEGQAINVSEVVNQDLINSNIIKYSGTIEDFLIKERSCENIHFHKTMNLPSRAHLESCSFSTIDLRFKRE